MTSGDFAIGLSTIITGLAITVMLANLHALLVNRRRVRWDWLTLLAASLVFMLIVDSWGVSFRQLANRPINPPLWLFLIMLGDIIPMYLAARAVFPDYLTDEGVNLATHYAEISRFLWSSLAFSYALYLAWSVWKFGAVRVMQNDWLLAAQMAVAIFLLLVRQRRAHELLVPVVVLLFCFHHLNEPLFA
jgi:hypothetical protein